MTLSVGAKVEPFSFTDHSGKEWNLPSDLGGKKAAFFFLRHLGCPLCKDKVDDLKKNAARFEEKGVMLFAVVQSTPRRCEEYARKTALPYPLIPDREKRLYEMFDVKRGGLKEFTAPSAFMSTVRATLKGHMHGKFEGDEFQVPASFLLSGDGEVLMTYYGKDVSDFGSSDYVLAKS